jgi:N-methylhydantoinase A
MRFACDTGGTFTDLVVEDDEGLIRMFKAPTIPADPVAGVLNAIGKAAGAYDCAPRDLLTRGDMFIYGTTHAINAIITGRTAKTAFLTTKGHPDILVIREGGRAEPFNYDVSYPEPYVPRALTFEVPGRILSDGTIDEPLDEAAVRDVIEQLARLEVEAVAVCLLWSIVNSAHELQVGALLDRMMPDVPHTLSHQLNPATREYRRASSTCIDASLKPLMARHMGSLTSRLAEAGFGGRVLVLTSQGGMLDAEALSRAPIHAINSGPSMAPLAGRHYAVREAGNDTAIVADTGGTTYDVSLVRSGDIPFTREMWIGEPFRGHMTGFPSVDVRSIGAGGGSIASVDSGGLLHVGPESAGAAPGPVCYGQGGTEPTLTDACVVLGYVDPDFFLGGSMKLNADLSRHAVQAKVAGPLKLSLEEAAAAIVDVATENMIQAIADITINQGIDPAGATLVGGGGAAGLNAVFIARRLGCDNVVIPDTGPALSAAGALMSDLSADYQSTEFTVSDRFDYEAVNRTLEQLETRCRQFVHGPGKGSLSHTIDYLVEARYEKQVWEIDVPLTGSRIGGPSDLATLIEAFHRKHEEIFAFRDPGSPIECVTWIARIRCRLREKEIGRIVIDGVEREHTGNREAYFSGVGWTDTPLYRLEALQPEIVHQGPSIVESPFTSVVIDPMSVFKLTHGGSLVVSPNAALGPTD